MTSFDEADVIVCGAGGAGLAAAIEAADAGAGVLVFEAADQAGGSTALSAGVFYAADTSVQRAAGVHDSVPRMFEYYQTFNQWTVEPWLARTFCEESGPTLEWLIELGVEYDPSGLYVSGVDDTPRGHQCRGGGAALVSTLVNQATARGVTLTLQSRVEALVVERGQIVGVDGPGFSARADAVVLTTGGFGANRALLDELYPPAVGNGPEWTTYFGSPNSNGDAIVLGRTVGAAIAGAGRGLVNWTAGLSTQPSDFCPSWLIFVNLHGCRFMDEAAPYAVAGDLIRMQPGARCYAVFDDAALSAAERTNARRDKLGVGDYVWERARIDDAITRGTACCDATLEKLARKAGIRPRALENTVRSYNEDVKDGRDRRFFRAGALAPIAVPPFFAVEIRPSSFGMTMPGLRIDPEARVYNLDEEPVPGLYAAGEASGGVLGTRYVGGGNAIANAIIFGRIAGRNAAAFAPGRPRGDQTD